MNADVGGDVGDVGTDIGVIGADIGVIGTDTGVIGTDIRIDINTNINTNVNTNINTNIRPATTDDANSIHALEQLCSQNPWNLEGLLEHINDPKSIFLVLTAHAPPKSQQNVNAVIGFACSSLILDELQINEAAVHPDYRGRGLGSTLLSRLLAAAAAKGAVRAFLEVRVSNRPAIRAYEKCGFKKDGVRKGYYQNGEDAVLMSAMIARRFLRADDHMAIRPL